MAEQNLSGFERATSIALGLAAIGMGIRRGGISGWMGAAAGVLAAKRGFTGHCAMKAAITPADPEVLSQQDHPAPAAVAPSPGIADASVSESRIDHALEETFPASDPISP